MQKCSLVLLVSLVCASFGCQGKIAKAGESKTIQGCVHSQNSQYTLTDDSGRVYQLTGATGELAKHVDEQVLVRGEQVESSQTPVAPADASSQGVPNRIVVSSATFTSQKCGPQK